MAGNGNDAVAMDLSNDANDVTGKSGVASPRKERVEIGMLPSNSSAPSMTLTGLGDDIASIDSISPDEGKGEGNDDKTNDINSVTLLPSLDNSNTAGSMHKHVGASALASVPLESNLAGSLDELLKIIDIVISTNKSVENEDGDIYTQLHMVASSANKALEEYSCVVDMSETLIKEPASDTTKGNNNTRESFRTIGKSLWMTIRSNPAAFHDHLSRNQRIHPNGSNNSDESTNATNRAAASGYIRGIAARLILIDFITTKGSGTPSLVISTLTVSSSESTQPTASVSELEFGVKCFARSGRALLAHGDNPVAAFGVLSLSVKFWEGLVTKTRATNSKAESSRALEGDVRPVGIGAVAENIFDEAFDAILLLPDAASLIPSTCSAVEESLHAQPIKHNGDGNQSCALGTAGHVLSQVQIINEVLDKIRIDRCEKGSDIIALTPGGVLFVQRYLPALAKTGYKHGNRFAVNKEYTHARDALKLALETTERCMECIREQTGNGSDSFHIQECEMLVVSKECLYVLSHVLHFLDQKSRSHKCLDQLETYINRQTELDEQMYASTMQACKSGGDIKKSINPTLALEGCDGDMADVKSRAQMTRARAKFGEAKERSNLAFSRIGLDNNSHELITDDNEARIDRRFDELAELSMKLFGSTTDERSLSSSSYECNALKLALAAARSIRFRRVLAVAGETEGVAQRVVEGNPYSILLRVYNGNLSKYVVICLDYLRVTIATIQSIAERDSICKSAATSVLDGLCVELAKDITNKIISLKSQEQSQYRSDLIPDSKGGMSFLIKESQIRFAEGLSLYRSHHDAHEQCVQWADFLIFALSNFEQSFEGRMFSTHCLDGKTQTAISDVMAAKALALAGSPQSGHFAAALKVARKAWEIGPSLHTLAVLFHCGVLAETNDMMSQGESLLELDNALASLVERVAFVSNTEVLALFPVLSNSCITGDDLNNRGIMLLGIQERWLKKKVEVLESALSEGIFNEVEAGAPLLFIVRAYLRNFELVYGHSHSSKRDSENLVLGLDQVLLLFCKIRDFPGWEKRSVSNTTDPFPLIWDSAALKSTLGEQKDCVWIAEQLWNLGTLIQGTVAPSIFAKAHDFSLLAEEEIGQSLTKGYLDSEKCIDIATSSVDIKAYILLLSHEKERSPCELCSEFSAQCLLVSVAAEVDNTSNHSDDNETFSRQKRNLLRLTLAKRELSGLERPDQKENDYTEGLVSWLELRCLLIIRNDFLCVNELVDGGLLLRLSNSSISHLSGCTDLGIDGGSLQHGVKATHISGQTLGASSILSHVLAASFQSRAQHMPECAKLLLQSCVNEMIRRNMLNIAAPDGSLHSLGQMQRSLVSHANCVDDVTAAFASVDSMVKSHYVANVGGNEVNRLSCYTIEELEWFAVESYNRGLSLFNLGDGENAEKMISVSLNLVPDCGKEIESYASDMRQAFATIMDRKVYKGCTSSESVLDLFSITKTSM